MGAIRKTMSVATLGLVPFRSKKERLERAELSTKLTAAELDHEREAREAADRRLAAAERRARDAEKALVATTRRRGLVRGRRRKSMKVPVGSRVSEVIDLTDSKLHDIDEKRKHLGKKLKKRASGTSKAKERVGELVGR